MLGCDSCSEDHHAAERNLGAGASSPEGSHDAVREREIWNTTCYTQDISLVSIGDSHVM